MTREEQVAVCMQCKHRKKDFFKGVICGLTNEKPTFQIQCSSFSQNQAQVVNQTIEEKRGGKSKKEKAKNDMIYGALWCGGGILVTAITYSAASGGGRYFAAYGAIIYGGYQFIRGLINNSDE